MGFVSTLLIYRSLSRLLDAALLAEARNLLLHFLKQQYLPHNLVDKSENRIEFAVQSTTLAHGNCHLLLSDTPWARFQPHNNSRGPRL